MEHLQPLTQLKLKSALLYLSLFFLLISKATIGQSNHSYYSLTLASKGTTFYNGNLNYYNGKDGDWILDKPWKYSQGDDINQAKPDYDDSRWDTNVNPLLDQSKIKPGTFNGCAWFRIKLFVDSSLRSMPLQFIFAPAGEYPCGAIDIYIDGTLAFSIGKTSASAEAEKTEPMQAHNIAFNSSPFHTIAIRYSNFERLTYYKNNNISDRSLGIQCELIKYAPYIETIESANQRNNIYLIVSIFYLTVTFVHLMLFFFYRTMRSNLYYSLFTLCIGSLIMLGYINGLPLSFKASHLISNGEYFTAMLAGLFLLSFYYSVFYPRMPKMFWIALALVVSLILFQFFTPHTGINLSLYAILEVIFFLFTLVETIRVVLGSIFEKLDGAWIIATGVGFIFVFAIYFAIVAIVADGKVFAGALGVLNKILAIYAVICIPVSMSIYLSRNFARTSKRLALQLVHVKQLSEQNFQLINGQKERLEIQVNEKTAEILSQKNALELKNKEVTDSINYAKRIQTAILPKKAEIKNTLPNSFILFKPKAIVSGDFYFFSQNNGTIFLAAADCTGHGVPGAFMSMIGTGKLSDAVEQSNKPGEVLKLLNQGIKISLHQSLDVESTRDGMDIALCSISTEGQGARFTYSGANRPLWIIRKGSKQIEEIKATKKAIGGFTEEDQVFETHHVDLTEGDTFYLFSDGYADQFGGDSGKKLTTKVFKDMLLRIQDRSMHDQEVELDAFIEKWKGEEEQLDDILVIGVKI